MGTAFSSRRRHNYNSPPSRPLPPPQSASTTGASSSSSSSSHSYAFAANAPYPFPPQYPPQLQQPPFAPSPPPPPPPPPPYHYCPPQYSYYGNGGAVPGPIVVRPKYPPYYTNHPPSTSNGWSSIRPPPMMVPAPLPPYVEHQKATTIKNDVNLRKETIRLELDEQNPDHHLVAFTFDSTIDGSITIFYYAKEGANCSFSPHQPDIYKPVSVPFQKGLGQKFRQPSGIGIDLGFFELEDLSKPLPGEVFPLVILVEACMPPPPPEEQLGPLPTVPNAQITQAVIEKKNGGPFEVKVIKQILWVNGVRYELHEIYGIGNSATEEFDDNDPGKECVICLSEPKDTAVLPCRHMCMCSECAKVLRLQSNRCPICRQPVEQLIEIKMKKGEQ